MSLRRRGKARFSTIVTVVSLAAIGFGATGVSSAAAVVSCPADPVANDQNYTVGLGKTLNVAAPGLLATDTGTSLLVEVSWGSPDGIQGNPDPSDDASLWGTIRYGTPGGTRNRAGGFTYTQDMDPNAPFTGIDTFDYWIIDACGTEDTATAYVTVKPIVVDSSYSTATGATLTVPVGSGFLAHDQGVDPASMYYDATSAHGGTIDDNGNSDGSFVYTPKAGFKGSDSFGYQVYDLNGDNPYSATVHIQVGPTAPGAPTSVHASASGGKASVSWVAPANHGSAISSYTVTASPGAKTAKVSTTHATISGLAAGTYTFKVRATNAVGTGPSSSASNSVRITTATTATSTTSKARSGYWMVGSTGTVYPFGQLANYGNAPTSGVTHIEPTPSRRGYWVVDARGNVFAFGDAAAHGAAPSLESGESVSSLSSTPTGKGYWLFTNRGRVVARGDAKFLGDLSNKALNGPIVGSVATTSGKGYYMVASDGGIFAFGDAKFHGSMGAAHLNQPVNGLVPTSNGGGYWLVASDGGIFAFGNAGFHGSMGGAHLNRSVIGMVRYGKGYLMVASDGGIFAFSNLPFLGSLGGTPLPFPIVGVAAGG